MAASKTTKGTRGKRTRKVPLYDETMKHLLRRQADGSYETVDGLFTAWAAGHRRWYWYDSVADKQYGVGSKAEAAKQIAGVRNGFAPEQSPIPPKDQPARVAAASKQPALRFEPYIVGEIKPRPIVLERLMLAADGETQIVIGMDDAGRAHVLWTTPRS
jgi:hypothetical protein